MKKEISTIAKEFVYGGHLLSLGASGIVLTVVLLLDLPIAPVLLIIAYLCSQIVYSYNHFKEIEFDISSNPERSEHIKGQRKLMSLSLGIYGLLIIICLAVTNIQTIIATLFIVIGGVLYTEYFKEFTKNFVIGFKTIYVSFFWAMIIFLVPFFYEQNLSLIFLFLFLFVFLRWIVNSAFFDIKDVEDDGKRKLKTFAVLLGKEKTIYFLILINILSFFPLWIGYITGYLNKEALSLILLVIYGAYYLIHALFLEGKKLRELSYIVVDAEYIFWPIPVLLAQIYL